MSKEVAKKELEQFIFIKNSKIMFEIVKLQMEIMVKVDYSDIGIASIIGKSTYLISKVLNDLKIEILEVFDNK